MADSNSSENQETIDSGSGSGPNAASSSSTSFMSPPRNNGSHKSSTPTPFGAPTGRDPQHFEGESTQSNVTSEFRRNFDECFKETFAKLIPVIATQSENTTNVVQSQTCEECPELKAAIEDYKGEVNDLKIRLNGAQNALEREREARQTILDDSNKTKNEFESQFQALKIDSDKKIGEKEAKIMQLEQEIVDLKANTKAKLMAFKLVFKNGMSLIPELADEETAEGVEVVEPAQVHTGEVIDLVANNGVHTEEIEALNNNQRIEKNLQFFEGLAVTQSQMAGLGAHNSGSTPDEDSESILDEDEGDGAPNSKRQKLDFPLGESSQQSSRGNRGVPPRRPTRRNSSHPNLSSIDGLYDDVSTINKQLNKTAKPSPPESVLAIKARKSEILKRNVPSAEWSELFKAFQTDSFAGVTMDKEDEPTLHFYFWEGETLCCPVCGNMLCTNGFRRDRVVKHGKLPHYMGETFGEEGERLPATIELEVILKNKE